MVRRTALNDAGVLAYRHYENFADLSPNFRISLYPRDSIDNGTFILRKALWGRRTRLRAARRDRLRQHPGPVARPGRRRAHRRHVLVDATDGQLRLYTPERDDRAFLARSKSDGSPCMRISRQGRLLIEAARRHGHRAGGRGASRSPRAPRLGLGRAAPASGLAGGSGARGALRRAGSGRRGAGRLGGAGADGGPLARGAVDRVHRAGHAGGAGRAGRGGHRQLDRLSSTSGRRAAGGEDGRS